MDNRIGKIIAWGALVSLLVTLIQICIKAWVFSPILGTLGIFIMFIVLGFFYILVEDTHE